MVDLVDPDKIEGIVGIERDPKLHYGRAVSAEETFYILHSHSCRESGRSLLACQFSLALGDHGINKGIWGDLQDRPVPLEVSGGRLVPRES